MAMPETAVHEDGPLSGAVGNVRRAGKITVVNAITKAELVQELANSQLRDGTVLSHLPETLGRNYIDDKLRLPFPR